MIEQLLPAAVAVREAYGDSPGSRLMAGERELVAGAVPARQREFATVRRCARDALARLGIGPVPILPGHRGAPRWPAGVVGSMTHCAGYRAAAVARAADLLAIGIDAEPDEPIASAGSLALVALPEERRRLGRLAADRPDVCWDRLLFSAKESVYKVWSPLTGRPLDFDDALVTIDPEAGTFRARLLVPDRTAAAVDLTELHGRWAAGRGLLVTAVTVPAAL